YRRVFDADASLTLVGGVSAGSYWSALGRFVDGVGLSGVVRLGGSVPGAGVGGVYRSAGVVVCLSGDGGVCVAVLGAMAHGVGGGGWGGVGHGVGVVGWGGGGGRGGLGGGGWVLGWGGRGLGAGGVGGVLGEGGLRGLWVGAGRRRLEHFSLARTRHTLLDALQ